MREVHLGRRDLLIASRNILAALALVPRLAAAAPDLDLKMSVDILVPSVGQPAQFTVTLRNIGTDAASAVEVRDKLPDGLSIPSGLAAFPGVGTYDAVNGVWTVGTLNAGASATLVIPVIVSTTNQPPCLVNVAEASSPLDTETDNNRAVAAVRRSLTDRCVDLKVSVNGVWSLPCNSHHADMSVYVMNAGPDAATNVLVDMAQTPTIIPGLRFTSTKCSASRCTVASVAPGSFEVLPFTSDDFANSVQQSVTLNLSASSGETDYSTSNNQASPLLTIPAVGPCEFLVPVSGAAAGCFIATAAFGSPLEPHVRALRDFRDRYLQRTELGRAFVRFYYRHSPPIAEIIARHEWLRFLVRVMLTPLVLAIAFPLRALLFLGSSTALLAAWRSRAQRPA